MQEIGPIFPIRSGFGWRCGVQVSWRSWSLLMVLYMFLSIESISAFKDHSLCGKKKATWKALYIESLRLMWYCDWNYPLKFFFEEVSIEDFKHHDSVWLLWWALFLLIGLEFASHSEEWVSVTWRLYASMKLWCKRVISTFKHFTCLP
jgi:hypothetical protein